MKKLITICLVCVGLIAANANATLYVETFSNNNAGWEATTVDNSGNVTCPAATYNNAGGNPDGYISSSLSLDEPRLYTLDCSYQTSPWGGYDR